METNRATESAAAIETTTIVLGKTTYTVVGPLLRSLFLMGPRGGQSHLVQSVKQPTMWAHVTHYKSEWYCRQDDGSFKAVR